MSDIERERKVRKWNTHTHYHDGNKAIQRPQYNAWLKMKGRCKANYHARNKSYIGCSYSEEWKNYDNFSRWAVEQFGFSLRDECGNVFQLDKDILQKGNKVYCRELCVFVPPEINSFFMPRKANKELPVGVIFVKERNKFQAQIKIANKSVTLGRFLTIDEAVNAYSLAKSEHGILLAKKYKGRVDDRVINILLKGREPQPPKEQS